MSLAPLLRRNGALYLSVVLFVACLASDGYYISGPNPRAWSPGWGLLLVGWAGLFDGTVAWLANPVLLAGWLMFRSGRHRWAAALALLAAALMLSFLHVKRVIASEAPTYARVIAYGPGYWLWLASALVLALGALLHSISATNAKTPGDA